MSYMYAYAIAGSSIITQVAEAYKAQIQSGGGNKNIRMSAFIPDAETYVVEHQLIFIQLGARLSHDRDSMLFRLPNNLKGTERPHHVTCIRCLSNQIRGSTRKC